MPPHRSRGPWHPALALVAAVLATLTLTGCAGLSGHAAPADVPCHTSSPSRSIARAVDDLIRDADLGGAIVVVRVETPDGRVLVDRDSDLRVMPASNMKLVVSACAIDRLGPEFQFATRVMHTAASGDLYLVGGGDPSLSTDDLGTLADAVAAAGIDRITGDLVADATLFDDDEYGVNWSVGYLERWYAAPVSALSVNRNIVRFRFQAGDSAGAPVTWTTTPADGPLEIVNRATTADDAPEEPSLYLDRELWAPRVILIGSIRPGAAEHADSVTVTDPPRFALELFARTLAERGIEIDGELRAGTAPVDAVEIAEHRSKPLGDLLYRLNKYSDNHYAEQIFRTLGAACGRDGGRSASEDVVLEWVQTDLDADPGDVAMADGSGLSRYDLVTARVLTAILQRMADHEDAESFRVSLPVSGGTGTLRWRMRDTPAEDRVHAKTGYIGRVRALSGYILDEEDEIDLVFSIVANNYRVPVSAINRLQDDVCNLLMQHRSRTRPVPRTAD